MEGKAAFSLTEIADLAEVAEVAEVAEMAEMAEIGTQEELRAAKRRRAVGGPDR